MIFNIKNNHKNDFQVYLHFYNPLKVAIKSSQKDVDDPFYKAITDFIAKLPAGVIKSADENKDKVAFKDDNMTDLVLSVLLNQWIFEFTKGLKADSIPKHGLTGKFNEVAAIVNDIAFTENFLYSEIGIPESGEDKKRTVTGWVKHSANNLYKAEDDYEKFTTEILKTASDTREGLSKANESAQKKLKAVQALLTTDFSDKIAPLLENFTPTQIKDFKKYSSVFAKTLATSTRADFAAQETAITQDSSLINRLTLFCKDFTGESIGGTIINKGFRKEFNDKLDWKTKTMKEITFSATALKEEGAEDLKKTNSKSFTIAKKLGVYPFISTGVLYTNFSYPEYALKADNGSSIVAKTGDVKVNVRPTVFLNMIIASWDPVYPFAQVGITTGVQDALFPVGLGFSFGASFSISGGVIFGYHKDLNKLTIGGSVKDDATLKADLTNKAVFKPYFSINYNFGKK